MVAGIRSRLIIAPMLVSPVLRNVLDLQKYGEGIFREKRISNDTLPQGQVSNFANASIIWRLFRPREDGHQFFTQ